MLRQLALMFVLAGTAAGATIHLTDGSTMQGEIHRDGNNWLITTPDGQEKTVPASAVKSIDLVNNSPQSDLAGQLASLQRSVDLSADPKQAVERYQTFITRNPGTPAADEAKKDLAVWQDRMDRRLVRVGTDWVTPAEFQRLRSQTILIADHARQLIRDSKMDQAQKLVNQILAVDPHSAAGLYLNGVLSYNQNQLAAARKDFEAVAAILPHHGPTLNNLAVILYRNNRFGQAVYEYDQALTAAPLNRQIIDNIAEALHAMPAPDLATPGAKLLQQHFARQDAALQPIMAKQGLSRFGAKWVNKQQLQQIQTAQKLVQDQLTALQAQQTQTNAQIAAIDVQIAADTKQQQSIASSSYILDPNTGRMAYVSYPPEYYQLGQDITQLKAQRQASAAKMNQIGNEMRATQTQLPIQPYTGVQQIIGEEGTPISLGKSTTQPDIHGR